MPLWIIKITRAFLIEISGKFNDLTHYHMHVISRFEGQPFYNEEQKDHAKEKAEFLETKAN